MSASTGAAASNEFGSKLFKQLCSQKPKENIVFSPASISVALAMTLAGAKGECQSELQSVLSLAGCQQPHSVAGELNSLLGSGRAGLKLALANRIFSEKGFSLLPEFTNLLAKSYAAEVGKVDFANNSEAARQEVNSWVEAATSNKIRNLLAEGSVDANTRLVLVNAIHFKGTWTKTFNSEDTYDGQFEMEAGGKLVETKFMTQTANFRYVEGDGLRLLQLPFAGGACDAAFVLPTERHQLLQQLEKAGGLDAAIKLQAAASKEEAVEVEVHLPRFKVEAQASLEEDSLLPALGLRRLFRRGEADLSGISSEEQLFVSKVVHKAFLEVNEEGAEAAAATAVAVACFAMPMNVVFMATEPFLMLITDRQTGALLFASRVCDPSN